MRAQLLLRRLAALLALRLLQPVARLALQLLQLLQQPRPVANTH
jgi:hypothetical protein